MSEVATWIGRIMTLVPEMMGLWKAVKAKDEPQTLDAVLALRRKISDAQMLEELREP